MKAIVQDTYGSTEVLSLSEIDRPEVGEHEVLVRVRAAGLDAGVWHLMTGRPYLVRLGFGLRGPKTRVRGMDVAGTVESVGSKVTRFTAGDEVFGACDGSFAEYACAREDRFEHKPSNLSLEQSAAVAISGLTALQALRDVGKLQPGQKVLVIGAAGGVGTFAVQLAKAFGAEVTGVCSTSKMELVRSLGADDVIDYTSEDFADRPERYDLILDTAGNRSLSHIRRALTPEGTLVIIGGSGGPWLGGTERQMQALCLSPFVKHTLVAFLSREKQADLSVLKQLIEASQLTPVIDRCFPLNEAPAAIRYLEAGRVSGKVLITV